MMRLVIAPAKRFHPPEQVYAEVTRPLLMDETQRLLTVMKEKTDGFTPQEKAVMEELCGAMLELLTKPYEYHMIDFLCDAENYFSMTEQDFARWDDKVLLILSEDDTTFNQACKDSLIAIMPHPTVVTRLTGGHLALMVRLERYAELVTEYIQKRI